MNKYKKHTKNYSSEYNKILRIKSWLRSKKNQYMMKYFMKDEHISHIAMFHKITTTGVISDDQDECRIEDMIGYLEHCLEIGIEFVSIDTLLSMEVNEASINKAVITFDDGFESLWTVAAQELCKRNIPFTCFIITSVIGENGYITSEQLRTLSKNKLCTIGMHSDQHIFWRDRSTDELINDYLKCKHALSDIVGYEPSYYAFPYGTYETVSSKNIRTIRNMSPKAIFLTDQRKLTRNDIKNPLRGLPRLDIGGDYRGIYREEYIGLSL